MKLSRDDLFAFYFPVFEFDYLAISMENTDLFNWFTNGNRSAFQIDRNLEQNTSSFVFQNNNFLQIQQHLISSLEGTQSNSNNHVKRESHEIMRKKNSTSAKWEVNPYSMTDLHVSRTKTLTYIKCFAIFRDKQNNTTLFLCFRILKIWVLHRVIISVRFIWLSIRWHSLHRFSVDHHR